MSREIETSVRQSLVRGTDDLWKRLREVVSRMVDRLNEPDSRFHGTLVTNVCDLVDLLPRLNVSQDPELDRFAAEVRNRLCNFTSQELKKDDALREATASDAGKIVAQMDEVLRSREAAEPEPEIAGPSVDHIFAHMSAYLEAPAA